MKITDIIILLNQKHKFLAFKSKLTIFYLVLDIVMILMGVDHLFISFNFIDNSIFITALLSYVIMQILFYGIINPIFSEIMDSIDRQLDVKTDKKTLD